jgi:hypothetical protein
VLRGHTAEEYSAAFSRDGSRIVTASLDQSARIWDAATGKEIAVLRGHDAAVRSAAFSPDGSRIVTASEDRTARIWDAATAKEILVLRGHEAAVIAAAFSPWARHVPLPESFESCLVATPWFRPSLTVRVIAPLGVTRIAASPFGSFALPLTIRPSNLKVEGHPPVFVTPWPTHLPSNWLTACVLCAPATTMAKTVIEMNAHVE